MNTFTRLSDKEESARRAMMDKKSKENAVFKAYQEVRYFMRDIDELGNNVHSIADMRAKLDTFTAMYGHGNYSRNLEAYLKEAVENANEKAFYNKDGTKKAIVVMGEKTFTYDFGERYASDNRNRLDCERTATYTDTLTGKVYQWQAIAFVDRKEGDFYGRIRRFCYLNGVLFQANDYAFGRVNNPLLNTYSDPEHVVNNFLVHAEFLTKQLSDNEAMKG